jgi:hypothetical protein
MSRKCITCGIEIDPRRIAILPNTQTCTKHSTAEKKVAVTVQKGEGDHTWIETYAVEREDYDRMMEIENNWKKQVKETPAPKVVSTDEDEVIPTVDDFETDDKPEVENSFEEEIDDYDIGISDHDGIGNAFDDLNSDMEE